MKKLGENVNGNYKVFIMDDGTKIRVTPADEFLPERPESLDLKITNRCTGTNCAFCHERSGPTGEHGDIMNLKFIDTLLPYTELAIGGGNVLEHPDLVPFLEKCKERKLICNATFNQVHFMESLDFIKDLVKRKLIYGVGVSLLTSNSSDAVEEIADILNEPVFGNAVVHVINGIHTPGMLEPLRYRGIKILILGYKTFGRGVGYAEMMDPVIKRRQAELKEALPSIQSSFGAVSFDNLAISQLDVRHILTPEEWDGFYMGDEGQFTMYVDAVKKEFAESSVSEERFPLLDDAAAMLRKVREGAGFGGRSGS